MQSFYAYVIVLFCFRQEERIGYPSKATMVGLTETYCESPQQKGRTEQQCASSAETEHFPFRRWHSVFHAAPDSPKMMHSSSCISFGRNNRFHNRLIGYLKPNNIRMGNPSQSRTHWQSKPFGRVRLVCKCLTIGACRLQRATCMQKNDTDDYTRRHLKPLEKAHLLQTEKGIVLPCCRALVDGNQGNSIPRLLTVTPIPRCITAKTWAVLQ